METTACSEKKHRYRRPRHKASIQKYQFREQREEGELETKNKMERHCSETFSGFERKTEMGVDDMLVARVLVMRLKAF